MRSIAVTTDFSTIARKAFPVAADLARRFAAPLFLVHWAGKPTLSMPWEIPNRRSESSRLLKAHEHLGALAKSTRVFQGLHVSPRVVTGDPAECFRRFQDAENIDLFVVSSQQGTDSARFPLGSFTASLLSQVTCPILVVTADLDRNGEVEAAFRPSRLLVPYSPAETPDAVLAVAVEWADAFAAQIRAISVVSDEIRGSAPDALKSAQDRTLRKLRALRSARGAGRVEHVVGHGDPVTCIVDEAERYGAELIVTGSAHLSAPNSFLEPSVADGVIHRTRCPVLVLPGGRIDKVRESEPANRALERRDAPAGGGDPPGATRRETFEAIGFVE